MRSIGLIFLLVLSVSRLSYGKEACQVDSDCVLVQDSWCQRVSAIPKSELNLWKAEDRARAAKAAQERQTCKAAMGSELQLKNFKAQCKSKACEALILKPLE